MKSYIIANSYAAAPGKVMQNILIAKCYQQNRQIGNQYRDHSAPIRNLVPSQEGKLAWKGSSSMQLVTLSKYRGSSINRGFVPCNGLY